MEYIKSMFKDRKMDFTSKDQLKDLIDSSHAALVKQESDEYKKSIDAYNLSGTTAWMAILHHNKLIWANVGDSRAVLYTWDKFNRWDATQLSKDHKLHVSAEKERIERFGGVVKQFLNSEGKPFGPQRVWRSNQSTPGLAMSRSCGDTIAHTLGVISIPGIYC